MQTSVVKADPKTKLKSSEIVFGKTAMAQLWDDFSKKSAKHVDDVKVFQKYEWMLTDEQIEAYYKVVKTFVRGARQNVVGPLALESGKSGEAAASGPSSCSSGAAGGSAIVKIDDMLGSQDTSALIKTKKATKKEAHKEADVAEQKARLFAMLHKRKKA